MFPSVCRSLCTRNVLYGTAGTGILLDNYLMDPEMNQIRLVNPILENSLGGPFVDGGEPILHWEVVNIQNPVDVPINPQVMLGGPSHTSMTTAGTEWTDGTQWIEGTCRLGAETLAGMLDRKTGIRFGRGEEHIWASRRA